MYIYEIKSYSGGRMKGKQECAHRGLRQVKLVYPVVLSILAGKPVHGYRIAGLAAATSVLNGHRPDTAGIYHMLRNMEKSGCVHAVRESSDKGPARKTYTLTASGRACLKSWAKTLSEYHRAVGSLLAMARKAQTAKKRA